MERIADEFRRLRSRRAVVAAPFQGGRRWVEGQGFQPCQKATRAERIPMRSSTRSKFSLCDTEIRNQRSQNLLK